MNRTWRNSAALPKVHFSITSIKINNKKKKLIVVFYCKNEQH